MGRRRNLTRRSLLSVAIASAITLPSCSGETSEGIEKGEVAPARMPWDWHGLAGIVDDAGTWIVTPRYQNPYSMFAISSDGASLAVAAEGLTGIARCADGRWIAPPIFTGAFGVQTCGLAIARDASSEDQSGNAWGLVDATGAWVVSPRFTLANNSSRDNVFGDDGIMGVEVKEGDATFVHRWMDKSGVWADEGLAVVVYVRDNNQTLRGVRTPDGSWFAEPSAKAFVEPIRPIGCAIVSVPGTARMGIMAPDGSWALEPRFRGLAQLGDDGSSYVALGEHGALGIISADGSWIIKPCYEDVRVSRDADVGPEGSFIAKDSRTGLYGAANPDGSWLIPPMGARAMWYDSSSGSMIAQDPSSGLWGIAEPGGVWVLEPLWADVSEVRAGMVTAASHQAGPWGIGRPDGSWQIAPKYTSATWLPTPGTALVSV